MALSFSKPHRDKFRISLFLVAVSFYVLEGVLLNPLIVWTILPIYVGLSQYNSAAKNNELTKLPSIYGFLVVSLFLSYLYHFAWFFDVGEMQSGSSTSALIFLFFPIYCVILGALGWVAGLIYVRFKGR